MPTTSRDGKTENPNYTKTKEGYHWNGGDKGKGKDPFAHRPPAHSPHPSVVRRENALRQEREEKDA